MGHFAKIVNGVVKQVVVIANKDIKDEEGNEVEAVGSKFCRELFGDGQFIQCSYNGKIRKNYPGKGWLYNSEHDFFHESQPYASWTLNLNNGRWEAPVPLVYGEKVFVYAWSEEKLKWVRTSGHYFEGEGDDQVLKFDDNWDDNN